LLTEIEAGRKIPTGTVDYERAQVRVSFYSFEGVLQLGKHLFVDRV
jgi:hypothetical protein